MEAVGANRHVLVCDVVCGAGHGGKVVAPGPGIKSRNSTFDLDETVLVGMVGVIALGGPGGEQGGSARARALAPKDDAAGLDVDLAGDGIRSRFEQHGAAEAVG